MVCQQTLGSLVLGTPIVLHCKEFQTKLNCSIYQVSIVLDFEKIKRSYLKSELIYCALRTKQIFCSRDLLS
jgi:hypothetical protein